MAATRRGGVRILHVIGWLAPRYGGPPVVVLESQRWLAARGHDVEVITTNIDGAGELPVPLGRPVQWGEATVTFHGLAFPRRFLVSWPLLADLLRRVPEFDVVHINGLYRFQTIAAAWACARHRVPFVLQPHGALDPWHRRQRRAAKDAYHFLVEDRIVRRAAALLATSSLEAQSLSGLGYLNPTWVIPLGVDAEALRSPIPADGDSIGVDIDRGGPLITFLGRLAPKKGLELLLESFAIVAATYPSARLVIAGPDDQGIGARLLPRVESMGLSHRTSFVGTVSGTRKRALLQRSNVFVLPSADESFGVAVAEAMAVGCPVVVSPHVAIAKEIEAAGAGLVAERDSAEIARSIGVILASPEAARQMGTAGRDLVDTKFAWPRVAAELEEMYQSILVSQRAKREQI